MNTPGKGYANRRAFAGAPGALSSGNQALWRAVSLLGICFQTQRAPLSARLTGASSPSPEPAPAIS